MGSKSEIVRMAGVFSQNGLVLLQIFGTLFEIQFTSAHEKTQKEIHTQAILTSGWPVIIGN